MEASPFSEDELSTFADVFECRLNACGSFVPCAGKFVNLVVEFLLPTRFPVVIRPGADGANEGRSMASAEKISAGSLVFACKAVHASIYAHGRKRVCASCLGSRSRPLVLRCSACDAVYYCSEPCAVQHRSAHTKDCDVLQRLRKYELNKKGRGSKGLDKISHEMFQGLALLLMKLQELPLGSALGLEALQEETACWSDQLRGEYGAIAKCAVSFLQESFGVDLKQCVVEQWLSRMHLNTFELGRNFGALIFDTMSFFNHGCDPNIVTVPVDDCQYLFAVRDIDLGEEVLTHYIDVDQPVQQRRKQLMQSFRFLCACERCKREGTSLSKKAQKQREGKAGSRVEKT